MPRKHRRVHHPRTNCRCPEGAKRVERCKPGKECKGRTFSCVATVLLPGARKPVPRFVKMICDPEAGPVKQWKPPPGKKKGKKARRQPGDQLVLRFNRETPPPEQIPLDFNRQAPTPRQMVLFNNQPETPADKIPSWWRT